MLSYVILTTSFPIRTSNRPKISTERKCANLCPINTPTSNHVISDSFSQISGCFYFHILSKIGVNVICTLQRKIYLALKGISYA